MKKTKRIEIIRDLPLPLLSLMQDGDDFDLLCADAMQKDVRETLHHISALCGMRRTACRSSLPHLVNGSAATGSQLVEPGIGLLHCIFGVLQAITQDKLEYLERSTTSLLSQFLNPTRNTDWNGKNGFTHQKISTTKMVALKVYA